MVRVFVEEIRYVEAFDHTIEVNEERTYTTKMPLHVIAQSLDGDFVKISRGCIVNLRFVKKLTKTEVILDSGKILQISRRSHAQVSRAFMKYVTGE